MRISFRFSLVVVAIVLCMRPVGSAGQTGASDSTITCRVIEAHASARPAVVAVVFHQAEKPDQPRLASLLLQHSGEEAEVQIGADARAAGSVYRLKSCFGRGLLLLPADAPALKDGATFALKFAETTGKN